MTTAAQSTFRSIAGATGRIGRGPQIPEINLRSAQGGHLPLPTLLPPGPLTMRVMHPPNVPDDLQIKAPGQELAMLDLDDSHEWTNRHMLRHRTAPPQRVYTPDASARKARAATPSPIDRDCGDSSRPPTPRADVKSAENAFDSAWAVRVAAEGDGISGGSRSVQGVVESVGSAASPSLRPEHHTPTSPCTLPGEVGRPSAADVNEPDVEAGSTGCNACYSPTTVAAGDIGEEEEEGHQTFLMCMVSSPNFDYAVGLLVLVNAIVVGIETEYIATHGEDDVPEFFRQIDIVFCLIFCVEITLRFVAYGTKYFDAPGWGWNVFDCTVVGAQVVELSLIPAGVVPESLYMNVAFMRVFRIFWVIRMVSALRVLHLVGELRTLVTCIGHSLKNLCWTVVLVVLVIFILSVWLTQIVSNHRRNDHGLHEHHPDLDVLYGSVQESMLVLFQAITGGIDWKDALDPLKSDAHLRFGAALFLVYIAFCVLAVMNIVTGVFVDSALRSTKEDKDFFMINNIRALFAKGKTQSPEAMTLAEFESRLGQPQMLEYFKAIDVDISEARNVFRLLDLNGAGSIEFEEFLSGCIGLRGPAKSLDLALVMRELRQLSRKVTLHKKCIDSILASQHLVVPSDAGTGWSPGARKQAELKAETAAVLQEAMEDTGATMALPKNRGARLLKKGTKAF